MHNQYHHRGVARILERGGQDPDQIGAPPVHFGAPLFCPPPLKRHPLLAFLRPSFSPFLLISPDFTNFFLFSDPFSPLFSIFDHLFSFSPPFLLPLSPFRRPSPSFSAPPVKLRGGHSPMSPPLATPLYMLMFYNIDKYISITHLKAIIKVFQV